jgi:hypothetical protein
MPRNSLGFEIQRPPPIASLPTALDTTKHPPVAASPSNHRKSRVRMSTMCAAFWFLATLGVGLGMGLWIGMMDSDDDKAYARKLDNTRPSHIGQIYRVLGAEERKAVRNLQGETLRTFINMKYQPDAFYVRAKTGSFPKPTLGGRSPLVAHLFQSLTDTRTMVKSYKDERDPTDVLSWVVPESNDWGMELGTENGYGDYILGYYGTSRRDARSFHIMTPGSYVRYFKPWTRSSSVDHIKGLMNGISIGDTMFISLMDNGVKIVGCAGTVDASIIPAHANRVVVQCIGSSSVYGFAEAAAYVFSCNETTHCMALWGSNSQNDVKAEDLNKARIDWARDNINFTGTAATTTQAEVDALVVANSELQMTVMTDSPVGQNQLATYVAHNATKAHDLVTVFTGLERVGALDCIYNAMERVQKQSGFSPSSYDYDSFAAEYGINKSEGFRYELTDDMIAPSINVYPEGIEPLKCVLAGGVEIAF